MLKFSFILVVALAVTATEGRARGSKLGHRSSKQNPFWSQQPRQQPAGSYGNTIQGSPTALGAPGQPSQGYQPQASQQSQGYQPQGSQQAQDNQQIAMTPGSPLDPSICKYPGFFPTPGSCVNFYRCVDWHMNGAFSIFQFNCPTGSIFDDELDACNHISWTVPKRPECADMLQSSLVPQGSGPSAGGTGGTGGSACPSGQGQVAANDPSVVFSMECSRNTSYKRHPLFCNRYYRCQQEELDWVFKTLTCPETLLFDESSQRCVDPALTTQCLGEVAPYPTAVTVSPVGTDGTAATEAPSEIPLDPSSQYPCPNEGYFPFEHDCVRFYKCSVTTEETLIGYRYKCPEGYGYSDELQRCAAESELPKCDKPTLPAVLRGAYPAIQLSVVQLRWFFDY